MATAFSCTAADLERENRLAEQIVDAILDGEPIQLSTGKHDFLAIETPAETDKEKGAVIILHGRGTHPDWSQVANPLRTALPAEGWATLSLQMPVLAKDAKFYDYVPIFPEALPRIDAGIRCQLSKGGQHNDLFNGFRRKHLRLTSSWVSWPWGVNCARCMACYRRFSKCARRNGQ